MGFFSILLLVIFVIVCLLLIFFVIIQDEESDSIGGIFASGAQSAFCSMTSNIVVRITYALGALFFVIAFSLAILNKSSTGNIQKVVEQESAQTATSEWWNSQSEEDQSVQGQLAPQDQTVQPEGTNTPATK